MLKIHWTWRVTIVKVKRQLGVTVDIYRRVNVQKLNLFGLVCRMTNRRLIMKAIKYAWRPWRKWLGDVE